MKKTILRAMIFGAMLISPMFVVSCSDDYDDSELLSEIGKNKTDLTDLQSKLDALTAAQAALPTAADVEAAKDAAIAAAKEASDDAIDAAVEDALQDAFDADASQLSTVQGLIDALKADLEAAINANGEDIEANSEAIADIEASMTEIADNITTLQNMLSDNTAGILANATDISDLQGDVTAAQDAITDLQDAITDLQTDLSDAITALNVKITTILNNLKSENAYYDNNKIGILVSTMKVLNDSLFGTFDFPYSVGDQFDSLKVWDGENIIVTANPSTIDLDAYDFVLATSQGIVPGLKLIPSIYDGLLTKTDNNLVQFEAEIDTTAFHPFLRDNLSSYSVARALPQKEPVYAVVAINPETERRVKTGNNYILRFDDINYNLATSVVRYSESDTTNTYEADKTGFGTEYFQGTLPSANVYKQYITLDDQDINGVAVDSADFTGLGEVIDGNKSIKISCTNKYAYNHQTIAFTVHYLYPDGTRTTIPTTLTFGELEFEDVTLNLDAYIDPAKAFDAQSSDTIALTELMNSVGTLSNWMNKAKQVKVEANTDNSAIAMPFTGTSFNSYDPAANPTTVTIGSPTNMVQFEDSLRTLFVTFDASEITEVGTYRSLFTFYDDNDQLVNRIYVNLNVKGMLPFAAPKKVTAVWNAPTLDLNTVWLQTSSDLTSVKYNMNKSYSEDITNMTFEDLSDIDTLHFVNQSVTTPLTTVMADQDDCTFNVASAYPIFGTDATTWVVRDTFSMKFRSAVAEADPNTLWDAANLSLIYENGGEFNIAAIDAIDPSNSSDTIHYLGTLPTEAGIVFGSRDYRIKSIDFKIVDPESTAQSDNLGMVQIESAVATPLTPNTDGSFTISDAMNSDVTSIKVVAIPDKNNEYPAVGSDYVTLNLVLKVTDVFGFVKEEILPFKVLSAEL